MTDNTKCVSSSSRQEQRDNAQNEPLLSTYDNTKYKYKYDLPVEEAVRMSIAAGCDVCIIGSHREEIRNVCQYRCGLRFRHRIPYCAVGQFIVTANDDSDGERALSWHAHAVTHPCMLEENFLETMVTKMKKKKNNLNESETNVTLFPVGRI